MCNPKNTETMKKKYYLKQHYQPECLYKKETYKELIPFYEIGIGVRPRAPEEKKAELGHKKFIRLCKLLKRLFAARNMWLKFAFRSKLQANRTRMCVYLATFNGILKVFRRRVSNVRLKMLSILHRVKEVQNKKHDIADTLATRLVNLSVAQTAADAPTSSSVPRARDHESDADIRSTFQEVEFPAPVATGRMNEDFDSIIPYEEYEKILRTEADKIQTERTSEQIQDRTDDRFVPYRVPVHGAEVPSDDEPQINIVVQAEVHEIPAAHRERTQLSPGATPHQDIASASLAFEAFRIDEDQGPVIRFEEQAISAPVGPVSTPIDDRVQASAAVPDRGSDDTNAIIPFDAYEEILRKESEIQSERIATEREQRVQTPIPFVPYRPRVHGREESSDEEPLMNIIVVQAEVHEIPAAHRERTQLSPGATPQDIASASLAFEAVGIDDQGPAQVEEQAISAPVGTVPAPMDDHVQVSAPVPDRESDDVNAIIPYDAFEELLRKESETQSKRTASEREQQVQTPVPLVPYRPPVHGRKEDSSDEEPQMNITVQAEVHEIPAAHRDPAELSGVAPPEPPTDIPQIVVTDADPTPGQQPIVSPEPQSAPTDQQALPANVFVDFAVPRIPKRKPRAKKRSGSVTPDQEAPPKKKRLLSSYTWYRMKTLEKRFNRGDRTKFKLSPVAKLRWSSPERDRYRCDENLLSLHSIMVMYQTRDVDAEEGSRMHQRRIKALVTARYPEEAPPPPKVSAPRWSRRTRHAIRKEDIVKCDEEEIIDLLRDTRHAELDEYKQWLVLKEDLLESRARGASLAQAGRKSSILGALAENIRQFQRTPKKQLYLELLHDHVRVGRAGDPEVPLETIQAAVLGAPLAVETEKVERSAPIVATPEEFLVPAPLVAESQVPGTAALDQPIELPVEPTAIEPPTARAPEDIAGAAVQVPAVADPRPGAEPRDEAPAVTGEVRSEEAQQDGIIIGGRVIPRELPVESRAEISEEAAAKSVTPEAADEEPAGPPPRPEGVRREDIEEKLRRFRNANRAVVTFSDICPPATTKKADAVRTMMFLAGMHKKGIVMDVDPNVELARDAILIRL